VQEGTRRTARGDNVHAHRVGRQADADVLESLTVVGEREPGVAVERLPVPALIVQLSSDRRVSCEETTRRQRKDRGHHHRSTPFPLPERDEDEREQQ
jgi:hypothetical protein